MPVTFHTCYPRLPEELKLQVWEAYLENSQSLANIIRLACHDIDNNTYYAADLPRTPGNIMGELDSASRYIALRRLTKVDLTGDLARASGHTLVGPPRRWHFIDFRRDMFFFKLQTATARRNHLGGYKNVCARPTAELPVQHVSWSSSVINLALLVLDSCNNEFDQPTGYDASRAMIASLLIALPALEKLYLVCRLTSKTTRRVLQSGQRDEFGFLPLSGVMSLECGTKQPGYLKLAYEYYLRPIVSDVQEVAQEMRRRVEVRVVVDVEFECWDEAR